MPIPASRELTERLHISCHKKLPHPFLAPHLCWSLGAYAPFPYPPLLHVVIRKVLSKFYDYVHVNIVYKMILMF